MVGMPRVLVACEHSGRVRRAFAARGWDAWSCDLLPADDASPNHVQGDVTPLLEERWDLVIAFPPCTFLCASGLWRNRRDAARAAKTEAALDFVRLLLRSGERRALENPVGCISTRIEKPTQKIQPYDFGEDASKATCLWLKGLPPLVPTQRIPPRIVNGKPRWANQTDSGQNRLGPSPDRARVRSLTYLGIAQAMADQWGPVVERELGFPEGVNRGLPSVTPGTPPEDFDELV